MKKNNILRIAALLLALTLATSCFVSGTFARYFTSDNYREFAQVAKWGVIVQADSDTDFFKKSYATTDTTVTGITNSVELNVDAEHDGVAPGTSSGDKYMTFSITGTPEVAVEVMFDLSINNEVQVLAGTYTDYTVYPYDQKFTLDENYYPVVFTLERASSATAEYSVVKTGNLNEIKSYLQSLNGKFGPNTPLDGEDGKFGYYRLSWSWEFGELKDETTGDITTQTKADTLLANVISNEFKDELGIGVVHSFNFALNIEVTQID